MREEEILELEEMLLKRLADKLTPLLQLAAQDAAKKAMHQLRLEMMDHISRHEQHIRTLRTNELGLKHIPTSKQI